MLTRVEYIKETDENTFAIVDAGMNDFLRSALYQARSTILPAQQTGENLKSYTIVGPVCESADVFTHDARLPLLTQGALLAITGVARMVLRWLLIIMRVCVQPKCWLMEAKVFNSPA